MKLTDHHYYRVLKDDAYLERTSLGSNGQMQYDRVDLSTGMEIEYIGGRYDALDYDVVPQPYFLWNGQVYAFQPSSFSGQIPAGYLEEVC